MFYVATLFLVVQIQWKSVFYDVLPVWISTRPECRGSMSVIVSSSPIYYEIIPLFRASMRSLRYIHSRPLSLATRRYSHLVFSDSSPCLVITR